MKISIQIEIDCEEKLCGNCDYMTIHHTGLVGEYHPKCNIFPGHYGKWGSDNMKRSKECIASQKRGKNEN